MEPRRRRQQAVAADDARSIHDLSDDLLWHILPCLDSPLWLIRAACVCKRWRRVITGADQGRAFLRLASSLHPTSIVGQYHNLPGGEHRFVVVPSSPLPAPIDASRFAIDDDLLQKPHSGWHVVDCHSGLVLLNKMFGSRSGPSYIVYDPLSSRHHAICCPPPQPHAVGYAYYIYGVQNAFLLDGDDGNISISNFRVMYLFSTGAPAGSRTCVFSRANGGENWLLPSEPADSGTGRSGKLAGRVDGCLYVGLQMGTIIALDNASLLFSKVELPIRIDQNTSCGASTFTVVDGGAGALGYPTMTSIVHVRGEQLELFRRVHGSGEWLLEHSIPNLSKATRGLSICLEKDFKWIALVGIITDGATFAILSACSLDSWSNRRRWFFSFDVNTMELRVLPQELYHETLEIFNYTLPWPQFLRACPCS